MVVKKKKIVLKKAVKKPVSKPKAPARKVIIKRPAVNPAVSRRSRQVLKPMGTKTLKKNEVDISNTDVDDLVVSMAGEDILPLVNILKGKENVSEFAIAEKLNVTVNQVRNMLYRLHKSNLVTFTRKKDKKKGWYIYYWTLAMKNIKEALFQQKKRQLADFNDKLGKEKESKFYVCPGKCSRMTMEDAMEADFHCVECGQLLTEQDNKRTVENLQNRIEGLSAEIKVEEDARAEELAKMIERQKRAAARKPKKKVVKKPIKKAVPKKAVKNPVKKAAPKKAVKKPVKKVIVKKAANKPAKGFFGKLFAKKKK